MPLSPNACNAWLWLCISDPTAQPELAYRGDFYGGYFRMRDLQASQEVDTWPEGITFRNIQTGERLAYRQGELVTL